MITDFLDGEIDFLHELLGKAARADDGVPEQHSFLGRAADALTKCLGLESMMFSIQLMGVPTKNHLEGLSLTGP